jgi:hypothetical protein
LALSYAGYADNVVYLDCSGRHDVFEAATLPEWAQAGPSPTKRLKFNEVTFNVTYKDVTVNSGAGNRRGFDHPVLGEERRAVVDRVLEYVGDVLNEGNPAECDIVFDVSESDGRDYLATAGPLFFQDPNGFRGGFAFDHITTGIDPLPGAADIVCRVDFGFPWYTKASLAVPDGEFDLFTALLHELTHGLGMLSVMGSTSSPAGGFPFSMRTRCSPDRPGP